MTKSVGVIRLLWLVGLVALAAAIALVVFARTSEPTPSPQSCTAPDYEKGALYEQGQQVQHAGQQFECWKDDEAPLGVGSWQWCKLPVYEPLVAGGPWKDAWKELGECDGFEGNRLTLSFATLSGKAPLKPAVPGVARADQIVTGTLRCKAEEIAISATANETIHLDNLKACDYQLVMNSADGYIPLNTPRIVSFKEAQGEEQTVTVKYRPPVEVSKLSGLPGIKIELFAQGLVQPRQMAMGKNVLYVGSSAIPSYVYDGKIADMIYALPLDGAGKPTGIYVIASGLEEPHGVAYRDGDLYYSTTGGLYVLRDADDNYKDPKPERVFNFPADDKVFPLPPLASGSNTRIWHQKHLLRINPLDPTDKSIYTAVGIPCNLCMIPADERYGTILRYSPETGESEILATGVRNSVGFDWNPQDGKLWFSDNNRQGFPNPDEVNVISGPKLHFGVPYRFGKGTPGFTQEEYQNPGVIQPPLVPGAIVSDKSLEQINPSDYVPAAFESGTNTAPLGVKFWSGFPTTPGTQHLLVAMHGAGSPARPGMDNEPSHRSLFSGPHAGTDGTNWNVSFMNNTMRMPYQDPKLMAESLFKSPAQTRRALEPGAGKLLEASLADIQEIKSKLSPGQRQKLDIHLDSVEQVIKDLEETRPPVGCEPVYPEQLDYRSALHRTRTQAEHHKVVATALSCGITRVATIQIGRSAESLNILDVSPSNNPHDCAHRRAGEALWRETRQWYVRQVKLLMDELAVHQDPHVPSEKLLQHTLVLVTSEMADGDPEHMIDMPLVLMGGASGLLKSGDGAGRYLNITSQADRTHHTGNPVIGRNFVDMQRIWATVAKAAGTSVPYSGNIDPVSGIFTNV